MMLIEREVQALVIQTEARQGPVQHPIQRLLEVLPDRFHRESSTQIPPRGCPREALALEAIHQPSIGAQWRRKSIHAGLL